MPPPIMSSLLTIHQITACSLSDWLVKFSPWITSRSGFVSLGRETSARTSDRSQLIRYGCLVERIIAKPLVEAESGMGSIGWGVSTGTRGTGFSRQ